MSSAREIMIISTEQSLQSPILWFLVISSRAGPRTQRLMHARQVLYNWAIYIPRAGELSLQVLNPQQQLMRLRPVPRSKAAPLVTLLMMFSSVSHTASHLLCKASAQHSNLQFWAPNPSKDLRHYSPSLFLLQLFTTVTTDVCPRVLPSTVWSDAVVS